MTGSRGSRILGGNGRITGLPEAGQFRSVVDLFRKALPLFADSIIKTDVDNENGLNRDLVIKFNQVGRELNSPFQAVSESMEDKARGNSPAADIGIHLHVSDLEADPPKIAVFEGKRLFRHLRSSRRREYVVGHEEKGKHLACGGIERFKKGIHGRDVPNAGMIGYIQDDTADNWRKQINTWIGELSKTTSGLNWSSDEKLGTLKIDGADARVSECISKVCRKNDELPLTHLWIDLSRQGPATISQ